MMKTKRSRRSKGSLRLWIACWLLVPAVGTELLAEETRSESSGLEFELEDQFGQSYNSQALESEYLLIVGGDRKASDESRDRALAVKEILNDWDGLGDQVELLRVADLRGVPAVMKSMVSKRMQKSHSSSILLDWSGVLVGRYEFQPRVANIALIERSGEVVLLLNADESKQEQIQRLKQALGDLEAGPQRSANLWTLSVVDGYGL